MERANEPAEDEAVERGAIALAFFNKSPRVPDNVTPAGFWKSWTPEAKEHYRVKVRAVLEAVNNERP